MYTLYVWGRHLANQNVQHGDMNAGTKLAALNKFRNASSVIMRQPSAKVLVVYDVQVKTPEVPHVPLVINYGMSVGLMEIPH